MRIFSSSTLLWFLVAGFTVAPSATAGLVYRALQRHLQRSQPTVHVYTDASHVGVARGAEVNCGHEQQDHQMSDHVDRTFPAETHASLVDRIGSEYASMSIAATLPFLPPPPQHQIHTGAGAAADTPEETVRMAAAQNASRMSDRMPAHRRSETSLQSSAVSLSSFEWPVAVSPIRRLTR